MRRIKPISVGFPEPVAEWAKSEAESKGMSFSAYLVWLLLSEQKNQSNARLDRLEKRVGILERTE